MTLRRREFISLLGGAAAWPVTARAQQPERMRRIGILSPGHSELSDPTFQMVNAFLRGLHELGYTEGQNLTVDRQYADGNPSRLRELAAELVRRKAEIIVAFSTTAARPAKQATARSLLSEWAWPIRLPMTWLSALHDRAGM
jgi:putative ABC transport system substrate-binding protein